MSLSAIMAGLAAMTVAYGTDSTNVWTYDSMFDTLNESDCPVRMIGHLDNRNGAGVEVNNLNNPVHIEWQIVDSLYGFPVMLDKGIENHNHLMWNYMDAYITAAKAAQCIDSDGTAKITDLQFSQDVRPYPDVAGGPVFWVVDVIVTVEEYR